MTTKTRRKNDWTRRRPRGARDADILALLRALIAGPLDLAAWAESRGIGVRAADRYIGELRAQLSGCAIGSLAGHPGWRVLVEVEKKDRCNPA